MKNITSPIKNELNIEAIKKEVEDGYINEQIHPELPLRILNYNNRAQFEWRWNDETMQCRGLIVDKDWNVVARPFTKFFSVEQLNGAIPKEAFEVYEKLDGSLGILYHVNGEARIATRGSFVSEQAIKGTEIYKGKYKDVAVDPSLTYLFEIIFPDNRIVVDYGDMEDLVLLAVINTETGEEMPLPNIGFPLVKKYDGIECFDQLKAMQDDYREGFVVKFVSGQRVKIKFDQYKRLHSLLTGASTKKVWEVLSEGGDLTEFVESVPDEFYQWVREVENDLLTQFSTIESVARSEMRFSGSRKELAQYFGGCQYPGVMFAILDRKNYASRIWKLIKPRDNYSYSQNG